MHPAHLTHIDRQTDRHWDMYGQLSYSSLNCLCYIVYLYVAIHTHTHTHARTHTNCALLTFKSGMVTFSNISVITDLNSPSQTNPSRCVCVCVCVCCPHRPMHARTHTHTYTRSKTQLALICISNHAVVTSCVSVDARVRL